MGDTETAKVPEFGAFTVSETVVVSVVEAEVPVIVTVAVPVLAVDETVKVKVDVPAPVTDVGLNDAVTPLGKLLADSATAESNPPATLTVIVEVPVLPCTTETALGEEESE